MSVVNEQSNLFRSARLNEPEIDPVINKGRALYATGSVANNSGDNTLSKYKLAQLPADCILHADTFFDVENWGFAQVVIGTLDDGDALVDQLRSAEAIVNPIVDGDANHGRRLWEVLGLSANPGGYLALYAHAEADATAAGQMDFRIVYITS